MWRVQWSHPRFGPILASCGYDKQVLLWKETSPKQYNVIYAFTKHTKSVNSICFFPESEGLKLVCGSSDGQVSVLQYNQGNNTWSDEMFVADESGVNAVQVVKYNKQIYIITGGCESILKVFVKQNNAWKCIKEVKQHQDWIRDIAAIVKDDKVLIASCSQDKTTIVYEGVENIKESDVVLKLEDVCQRVSFDEFGDNLAVTCADNTVTVFKNNNGEWQKE